MPEERAGSADVGGRVSSQDLNRVEDPTAAKDYTTLLQQELEDVKRQLSETKLRVEQLTATPPSTPTPSGDSDEGRVEAEIRREVPDARDFKIRRTLEKFAGFRGYYVEFQSDDPDVPSSDRFYYVLVDDKRCRLLDDGVAMLEALQGELDKRRSFIQRIGDFQLPDLIGGAIALTITIAFIVMIAGRTTIPPEFLAIFSVITGYFFGKNAPAPK